jgi:competence protein ComEC
MSGSESDGRAGVSPSDRHGLDVRLLVPALVAWTVLIALLAAPLAWLVVVAAACLVLAMLVLAAERRARQPSRNGAVRRTVALCALAVALLLAATALHRAVRGAGTITALAQQGAAVTVTAQVASDPIALPSKGIRRTTIALLRLQVREVTGRGARTAVNTPVLAFGDPSWMRLRWGETVQVSGRLGPARRGDDVIATLSGKGDPVSRSPPGRLRQAAGSVRSGLQRAVQGTAGEGAGLLPGLVVGDTSRLDPGLEEDMRTAGLTHLVAVSGSNVAIVCGAVLWLAGRLGLPRRLRAPTAGLALVAFVIVARPEPSVLRAAVMAGVGLFGLASARPGRGLPALSAAVLGLLTVDPWLARSYGFALSVLATLGLLVLARPWAERLTRWMPRPLAMALAVPLAAQAACGPVIVLLQGTVSLVAIPANLVADPMVAPATIAGVVTAVLSVVAMPLAHLVAWLGVLPADGITWVARVSAPVPSLPWPGGAAGATSLAVATLALMVGAGTIGRACRRHPWAAAAMAPAVVAAVVPAGSVVGAGWPPQGWVMVMCDVGQGDGLVLATSPGRAIVVDTGPDPAAMDRCLRRLHIGTVDLLVLTHDHADHVEGVPGVMHGRHVGELLLNGLDDPPAEARRVAGWASSARVPVRTAAVGSQGRVAGVSWRVLWPSYGIHEGSAPNNASIVLFVQSHGLRLLLLGDVETPAARQVDLALRALPGGPHVDVLKVAHHGSALQDPGLIQDADAPLAMVSVGAGNVYGHPALSTIRLLRQVGAVVRRTDQDGDLAVLARNGRLSVVTHPP